MSANDRIRLLLVEDDPADAAMLEALLHEHPAQPFRIETVSSLVEATAYLAWHPVDLVLLDLHLTDSEGWATFETLAVFASRVPIVVMSSLADEELADRAVRYGAQNYLIKGETNGRLLCRLLLHAIERHRIQSALGERTAALEESEGRFRVVVEELADGLVILDRGGQPLLVNRAARELFGATEAAIAVWLMERPNNRPIRIEKPKRRIVELRSNDLPWDGRTVTSVLIRDVTEQYHNRKLRIRVQEAQLRAKQAEELGRLRSEMVAKVTHELRTPMTPMRSIIDLLADGAVGPLSAEQRELVGVLGENVDRLSRFATKVLTTTRLDADANPPDPTAVELPEALRPIVGLLRHDEGTTIELADAAPQEVWIDLDDLVRVITNLVNNAIAHNAPGVRVQIDVRPADGGAEIWVEDNGQGIAAEHRSKVFDRFVQLSRHEGPGYRGTGLGLSICKTLIERAGGHIEVADGTLGGAAFRLFLPGPPSTP